MLPTDRDGILAILASMLVLFSAMLSPLLTVALVILVLVIMALTKLVQRPQPKR